MTALDRLRRARAVLLSAVAAAAALWSLALALLVVLVAAGLDVLVPLPPSARRLVLPAMIGSGAAALLIVAWRGRQARALDRVALYIEERAPQLRFALVTAAGIRQPSRAAALDRVVETLYPPNVLRRPVLRGVGLPAALLLALGLAVGALPAAVRDRVLSPRPDDFLSRPVARTLRASRLEQIAVRIEHPPYTRLSPRTVADPVSIAAVIGSRIEIRGRGAALGLDSMLAEHDGATLPIAASGDTWNVTTEMPAHPGVLTLGDRGSHRLLLLEPRRDLPPVVTILQPPADTTYAFARGTLALVATASDDFGLRRAFFEIRHSSGGGELFNTRRWLVGAVEPDGGRPVTLRVPARLDTMRLGPGDVLHVRAVALDENDVTGPDSGFSETRTIRIDDPRTRDTLRITPSAALPLDTTTLSQRMLIIEAESLLARRPRLDAGVYGRGARGLGQRQGRLRMRVEELLSTPEIRDISADLEQHTAEGSIAEASVASLLRDASRAMIDAESDLLRVRVAEALPHMRRALRFLDRARASGRLYLRGILPLSAVDLPKVRLKGEDPASVGARDPRPPVSDARRALLTRLERALPLRPLARRAFLDSLTLVRAAALSLAPDVAEPLGEAIERVRQGSDPSAALSTVRRRLRRDTQASPALSGWRGVP